MSVDQLPVAPPAPRDPIGGCGLCLLVCLCYALCVFDHVTHLESLVCLIHID